MYSSTIIWAFEPPAPKAEIPARLGVSMPELFWRFHSDSSSETTNGVSLKSMYGLRTSE